MPMMITLNYTIVTELSKTILVPGHATYIKSQTLKNFTFLVYGLEIIMPVAY